MGSDGSLLAGLRVLEVSILGTGSLAMHLADLGADVVKVESPGLGDSTRVTGGIPVKGSTAFHWRTNRGKRSITVDLATAPGTEVFLDLVSQSEVVVEGMRPGALARRGLGFERLLERNQSLVMVSISGFGAGNPYERLGAHGLAFDAYAGLAPPRVVDGRESRPSPFTWLGVEAGPLYGALSVLAAVLRARHSGQPCHLDVSESDVAAAWNHASISLAAAVAGGGTPEEIVALRGPARAWDPPGPNDEVSGDVRYQYYATGDGRHILFMATETKFWRNFCSAVGRDDLFARFPGVEPTDHDWGNDVLREELRVLFRQRTRAEWVELFIAADVPGGPVYTDGETYLDPQFQAAANWLGADSHGVRMLGTPLKVDGHHPPPPGPAPHNGEHTEDILTKLLGYDRERIQQLTAAGAFGAREPGRGGVAQ